MPMGGLGQRFRDAGVQTPKPLIPAKGVPMFQRALSAFDQYNGEKRYFFIVRKDAEEGLGLATRIKELLPGATITILEKNTRGAAETSLLSESNLDPDLPLVIMDCDITFDSSEYFQMISDATEAQKWDALLLSFESRNPHYSFARTDADGRVVETVEKNPISTNALAGAYFFTQARTFLEAAHELVCRPLSEEMKEYYISLVYNILIMTGKKIGLAHGNFTSFGTPEELAAYEAGE